MKTVWLCGIALTMIGACGDGDVTELSLNVTVDADGVTVFAREVARSCTCSVGEWIDPGKCGGSSDAISCTCDPPPASCLDVVRLEQDGTGLREQNFGDAIGGLMRLTTNTPLAGDGISLVLEGCGGSARIPIDRTDVPIASITEVLDGSDSITVRWDTEPSAASAIVSVSDGFVSSQCHVTAQEHVFDFGSFTEELRVSVFATAAPVEVVTELGTATVWVGSRARNF